MSTAASNGSEDGDGSFTALINRASLAAANLASAPPPPPPGQQEQPKQQAQDPATAVLSQLQRLASLADSLGLISPNEALRDISTPSLRAFLVPSLLADVLTRQRTPPAAATNGGGADGGSMYGARKTALQAALVQARRFLTTITKLNILPASTVSLLGARNELLTASASTSSAAGEQESTFLASNSISAPAAQSRQLKIALFKLERSLTASLDAYRQQARANAARLRTGVRAPAQGLSSSATAGADLAQPEEAFYDLLVLGREAEGDSGDQEEEEDDEDDERASGARAGASTAGSTSSTSASATAETPTSLRSYLLLLLNLHAVKTYALLESATQELVLLTNMPPPLEQQQRHQQLQQGRDASDSTWKLDTPLGGGSTSGALLDPKGRPLRPFTITGSTGTSGDGSGLLPDDPTARRQQLRQQVFQPSHRLPTMSIDDYLAEEERRGNVLRGGGPEGAAKATPKEERAIRAQMDGTLEGEEAEEEERREKIKWDAWSDEHRRGEGNTMNRG
ncbi:hypothetical protein CF319_g1162 [Tilletia indica]|nr:hypothetical protein CF319_g1162 [Tilletia indica]